MKKEAKESKNKLQQSAGTIIALAVLASAPTKAYFDRSWPMYDIELVRE